MRYFMDCEFIEDGKTIELISIGIVAEDGREYYAINYDCDWSKASEWVQENVLSKLPPKPAPQLFPTFGEWTDSEAYVQCWRTKHAITEEIAEFMHCECILPNQSGMQRGLGTSNISNIVDRLFSDRLFIRQLKPGFSKPEIWAYYADYDWVLFCQLFGTMMELPTGFPMYCRDIKQECDRLGNPALPRQEGEHHALNDARWTGQAWDFLRQLDESKSPKPLLTDANLLRM